MPFDFIKEINWVDILFLILLFRIGYVSIKSGFPIELFKLFGTLSAIYLAFHRYTSLSNFCSGKIGLKLSSGIVNLTSFVFLAVLGYLIFLLLRIIFYRFIKMDTTPNLNRWGGFLLGIIRGLLLASLIMYTFVISEAGYLKRSLNEAYLGKRIFKIAPLTYNIFWQGIMSKFFIQEEFNQDVAEAEGSLEEK